MRLHRQYAPNEGEKRRGLLGLSEDGYQRVHVTGSNPFPALAEREEQHVHVARWSGKATQPLKLGREVLSHVGQEYVSDLAEERARPPDRNAEVVEEFCVEIGAETGFVGYQDAEEGQVDLADSDVSADPGIEVDAERRNVTSFRYPNLAKHRALTTLEAGLDAGATLERRHEPLVYVVIATRTRQRDRGRQRLPGTARHWSPGLARLNP